MGGNDPATEFYEALLCQRIRQHLQRHPMAADTCAGIGLWWLGELDGQLPPARVQAALERLADEGVLDSSWLPSGDRLWFAARRDAGAERPRGAGR